MSANTPTNTVEMIDQVVIEIVMMHIGCVSTIQELTFFRDKLLDINSSVVFDPA